MHAQGSPVQRSHVGGQPVTFQQPFQCPDPYPFITEQDISQSQNQYRCRLGRFFGGFPR
jgi:hypothetical protein